MSVMIRKSRLSDIDNLVSLSKEKRLNYEKAQPQFWRYAGNDGDNLQKKWFMELLDDDNYLMFMAEKHEMILGFIIGKLICAPEVYNPGGLTMMIDDFCVQSEDLWETIGSQLIDTIKIPSKVKNASQILVVCGAHDVKKREFLMNQNLSITSEWFVGNL